MLDHTELFPGDHTIKIHGHGFASQMKTYIIQLKVFMNKSGYNMLARMLLHI